MRNSLKLFTVATLLFPLVYGCSRGNKSTEQKASTNSSPDTVKVCYTATYEGDKADMSLKIIRGKKVEGNLTINYMERPTNEGTVRGEFKGDTLFVTYNFKTGHNPRGFANPLAFLKKDSTLAMGVGQIETAYGRSYFVKNIPIDFEKGKFTFTPKPCK